MNNNSDFGDLNNGQYSQPGFFGGGNNNNNNEDRHHSRFKNRSYRHKHDNEIELEFNFDEFSEDEAKTLAH